ncbi:MAG: hypothetical protein P1U57_07160, partial [Oleibacter sp.]|nr:hypothetical protein [Thalassolituus sp.]
MRIILTSIFSLAIFCGASLATHAEEWPAYPKSLPQFQYEGDALKQAWPKLSAITGAEYPDEAWIQRTLAKYPLLNEKVKELSQLESSHPAVQALKNNDYTPLATALQDIWRLHFSGNFQQAYIKGAELTSLGMIPAVYSRLMNASLLIKDDEERMNAFKAIQSLSEAGLELLPGYFFGEFGLAFAKARMLEMMS